MTTHTKAENEELLDEFYRQGMKLRDYRDGYRSAVEQIRRRLREEAYSDDGKFLVSRLDYILDEEAAK